MIAMQSSDDGDALARGEEHVHLTRRWRVATPRGRAARGRRSVLPIAETTTTTSSPGSAGPDDVLGDRLDAVGVGHRRAAVLLHEKAHGRHGTGAVAAARRVHPSCRFDAGATVDSRRRVEAGEAGTPAPEPGGAPTEAEASAPSGAGRCESASATFAIVGRSRPRRRVRLCVTAATTTTPARQADAATLHATSKPAGDRPRRPEHRRVTIDPAKTLHRHDRDELREDHARARSRRPPRRDEQLRLPGAEALLRRARRSTGSPRTSSSRAATRRATAAAGPGYSVRGRASRPTATRVGSLACGEVAAPTRRAPTARSSSSSTGAGRQTDAAERVRDASASVTERTRGRAEDRSVRAAERRRPADASRSRSTRSRSRTSADAAERRRPSSQPRRRRAADLGAGVDDRRRGRRRA